MQGEPDGREDDLDIGEDEIIEDVVPEETIVMPETANSDNVGDVSVEINVEELIAQVEAEQSDDAARKAEVRRRLEEIYESKDIEDTYALEFAEK
ncbi:MAG: hypothetical protein KJO31_08820 [Gammaproteobacteria bacterium]|nr:hypothetical protein [Gammaproteobacteria bacterium]